MKKTCFLAILTASLMGGQVFAEVTGTAVEGCEQTSGNQYYGRYSETYSVTGGNVTIKADDEGEVPPNAEVYGGYAKEAEASNNTLTMQGGKVANIYGGFSEKGETSNNKVTMQGGTVNFIRGGLVSCQVNP